MLREIADRVFVELDYEGANVGCILTDAGAIVIDSPVIPGEAQHWAKAVSKLTANWEKAAKESTSSSEAAPAKGDKKTDSKPAKSEAKKTKKPD